MTAAMIAKLRRVPRKNDQLAETPLRGRAMKSDSEEIEIPADAVQKWQQIVDLLADIVHVPSAVVCKLDPPHYSQYRILASSNSEGNPFPVDDAFAMDIGTFCETVIKSREPLLVANA